MIGSSVEESTVVGKEAGASIVNSYQVRNLDGKQEMKGGQSGGKIKRRF